MAYTERRRSLRLGAAMVVAWAMTTQAFLITKPSPRFTSLPDISTSRITNMPFRGRTKSSGQIIRPPQAASVVAATTTSTKIPMLQWLQKNFVAAILPTGAAVGLSVVGGGALAGSLHTVTGPDHLAALLPRCVGRPWYQSMRIGAIWGLGHGLSAIIMGMVGFFLKDRVVHMGGFVSKLSLYTEVLIGLSLILIGILGIKEARHFTMDPQSLSSAKTPDKGSSGRAVFLNGLLHGFSWDGTPTLAPALAFNTWGPVMTFLVAYGAGTVASMSTATSLIGESTSRVGQALDKPSIPRNLSIGSSILAILIGIFWSYKAFV